MKDSLMLLNALIQEIPDEHLQKKFWDWCEQHVAIVGYRYKVMREAAYHARYHMDNYVTEIKREMMRKAMQEIIRDEGRFNLVSKDEGPLGDFTLTLRAYVLRCSTHEF